MTEVTIDYNPPGPIAAEFLADPSFVTGLRGPLGSGKSVTCVMKIMRHACLQEPDLNGIRRTRFAVIRNTYPELTTTTIKTWHEWVRMDLGRWQGQGPPTHHIKIADLDTEVLFLALDKPDDIKKLLSLELTGAWINEARELPKAILDALTGRVGRFPPARFGGCTWSGIFMDTNPPDTDHWWYDLAEEQNPFDYKFYSQPSGMDDKAENIRNLPKNYYDRMLAGKDDDWINVYVKGNYGFVRDGKPVYPEYNDQYHCQHREPVHGMTIGIGCDFGLTPAAIFTQKDSLGRWNAFAELVYEDMGAVRFAERLNIKINLLQEQYKPEGWAIWGDPSGDYRVGTDEQTPFDIMIASGISILPAPSNDPLLRREAVATALNRNIDGVPGLIISPKCPMLRKGMAGGYCYRRVQVVGEERYQDKPNKNRYSHPSEALQYVMLGEGEGIRITKRPRRGRKQVTAEREYNEFI